MICKWFQLAYTTYVCGIIGEMNVLATSGILEIEIINLVHYIFYIGLKTIVCVYAWQFCIDAMS